MNNNFSRQDNNKFNGQKPRGQPYGQPYGQPSNHTPNRALGQTGPNRYNNAPTSDRPPHNNNYMNNNYKNKQHQHNPNNPNLQMFRDDNTDNMDSNTIKKILIDYVHATVNLSNYKYKLIEYEHDLQLLKEKIYTISSNYMGVNGLLVFLKVNDQFLSYIIDKKYLTYNLEKIDYSKIKILPIKHHLDETIYNGTIIDGVQLFDERDGMKKFVINDVYYFRGQNLTESRMVHKMLNISAYFQSCENNNTKILNDTIFIVNKSYGMDEIDNLINKYIPKLQHYKAVSGVAFYPEFSAMKLIYLFSNSNEVDKPQSNKIQQNNNNVQSNNMFNNILQPQTIKNNEYEIIDEKNEDLNTNTLTFKVKKTNTNDVYHLYLAQLLPDNKLKYNKIGIAYMPTIECSHLCWNAFSNSNGADLLMDCKYDEVKNMWIPVKLAQGKRVDLITSLDRFVTKT
jgi:hypothetical protein